MMEALPGEGRLEVIAAFTAKRINTDPQIALEYQWRALGVKGFLSAPPGYVNALETAGVADIRTVVADLLDAEDVHRDHP